MKAWIYRHPVLSVLIPYLPIAVLIEAFVFFSYIDPLVGFLVSGWVLLLLILGVRRVGQRLMTDAVAALERDLDPARYLALAGILKSKKSARADFRLMMEADYAEGIDAAGHSEEALAHMDAIAAHKGLLSPFARTRFDLLYAAIAVHTPAGRERLPAFLADFERENAWLTGGYAEAVRASYETVRDALRFYAGDTEGLIPKYVAAVEGTRDNPFARRRHITACTWLARIYEKDGRLSDAAAMFSYVAANGGSLGLAAEAREALLRLRTNKAESPTPMKNTDNE